MINELLLVLLPALQTSLIRYKILYEDTTLTWSETIARTPHGILYEDTILTWSETIARTL
jgi:hypothetical protein